MNPIQPLPTEREISVTEPLGLAWARVKLVLFQPFDVGKWFIIGFCAWLTQLGQQGFGSPGGAFNVNSGNPPNGADLREGFNQVRNYVTENLYWLGPVILAGVILGLTLWLVFIWLNSRGQFMFLHCVARNEAEVAGPWRDYARQGNSLWLFRLALGILSLVVMGTLVALIAIPIVQMVGAGQPHAGGIALAAGAFLLLLGAGLVFFLIGKLTTDFVVPIMLLRGSKCLAGWRELRALLSGHWGDLFLYLLFQLVISILIGAAIMVVVLITCCLAGCLFALPYLGTVLLLPVLMFQRAYTAHYLAQFGREFDVFAQPQNDRASVS